MDSRRWWLAGLLLLGGGVSAWVQKADVPLPTGKAITPTGRHVSVGSYPLNMVCTPDGRYAIVGNVGSRQYLSVFDTQTGEKLSQWEFPRPEGLYFGLAARRDGTLFVSKGAQDRIARFLVARDGLLGNLRRDIEDPAPEGWGMPHHVAGLALSEDGKILFAANNQATDGSGYKSSISAFDADTGVKRYEAVAPAFPLAIAAMGDRLYVAGERDGVVTVHRQADGSQVAALKVGDQPAYLLPDERGGRLFVANSGSDSVSVVDAKAAKVSATILVRPAEAHGIPGVTPLGLALSKDGERLFVALADMNAVAVVDLGRKAVEGYIPTGWYPTSLALSRDGRSLLVACAKGVRPRNPNGKPQGKLGQYILNIIEGTVSLVPIPRDLRSATAQVLRNNRIGVKLPEFHNPGIEHVIYVIKENRTYDQVFGDLKQGNGDPSLCFFPREVTPNQHALAERFGLLDNFYDCAEVSADGWNWSTAGMVSAYTSRNTVTNYGGRGRKYDFEGTTNGMPVELLGIRDVAAPSSGYIWDLCARHKVSYRNYGFFVMQADADDKRFTRLKMEDNAPVKRALVGHTCTDFEQYNLTYPDSEAYLKHGLTFPRQKKAAGKSGAPSRFSAWKAEFDRFVREGRMPRFMMVRLPCDHTAGNSAGYPSMRAMVADNDYAVGQLVEAVSNSPFWRSTAICILEDDAQSGFDHVDAHRSIALVISPYNRRGAVDSRFYNTDSMLRTMELLLGLPPMNLFDAVARPIDLFEPKPVNAEPFRAILPPKAVMSEVNQRTAYRSKESERLFPARVPDPGFDEEQNDVIWHTFRPGQPKPVARR
jgi:YVTN family beta-propeller protein